MISIDDHWEVFNELTANSKVEGGRGVGKETTDMLLFCKNSSFFLMKHKKGNKIKINIFFSFCT